VLLYFYTKRDHGLQIGRALESKKIEQ
jgi:hypothetical protein